MRAFVHGTDYVQPQQYFRALSNASSAARSRLRASKLAVVQTPFFEAA